LEERSISFVKKFSDTRGGQTAIVETFTSVEISDRVLQTGFWCSQLVVKQIGLYSTQIRPTTGVIKALQIEHNTVLLYTEKMLQSIAVVFTHWAIALFLMRYLTVY